MALKMKESNAAPKKTKIKQTKQVDEKIEAPAKSGFLMKGKQAKEELAKERVKAKQRQAEQDNNVFRFYLKGGEEAQITFLDGDLDEDGDLENVCFHEHQLNTTGYPRYVCIADPANGVECPVCESGSQPYFATLFTVLVHKPWSTKKDPNRIHECSVQLFVAKSGVADKLRKKAKKYGGLAGVTFDASRSNKEAYNVGDDFDYVQKDDIQTLVDSFPDEVDDKGNSVIKVLDYESVLPYYNEDELVEFGFGGTSNAIGSEQGVDENSVL